MALGLCIQFIDLSTRRNIEQTPKAVCVQEKEEVPAWLAVLCFWTILGKYI
jgi:hypothetical protein